MIAFSRPMGSPNEVVSVRKRRTSALFSERELGFTAKSSVDGLVEYFRKRGASRNEKSPRFLDNL